MQSAKSDKSLKFKRIFPATVLTLLATTAIYALLRWVCLACGFEGIKEEAWRIYLPMLLAAAVAYGVLRNRIRIIRDNYSSRATPRDLIYMIVLFTGVIMLGTAQGVVTYKCASTTRLESLGDGSDMPRSRYYDLNDTSIELFARGAHIESRTISERHGARLEFHVYIVFPFEGQRKIWYGIHFKTDYRKKHASDEQVQSAFSSFISTCEHKLNSIEAWTPRLLERVMSSNDRDGYLEAVRDAGRVSPEADMKEIVILTKVQNIAEDRLLSNTRTLIWTFIIGMTLLALALLFVPLDRKRIDRNGKLKTAPQQSSLIADFQLTKSENWPIAGILAIMVGLFVAMTIAGIDPMSPSGRELLKWGAASHERVFGGEWWLLLSALFVHGGIMHLIGNVVTFVIGLLFAQDLFGGPKTTAIFIATGICSVLAAVIEPHTIIVGASGAIMGIYGAVLTASLSSKKRRKEIGNGFWWLIGSVVGLTLIVGMSVGISNTGHITGLLAGGVLGLLLVKREPQRKTRQTLPREDGE